ncbi:hypothetical protein WI41_20160 [Burkholderia latens]|uniref:Uncharacterized protein n=1 Tax=Burkholderia latens TaxID=488446 RepID=A0AAP1C3L2_9BURK|nr:hypothetical protein [Burkholderia latens]AOK07418.1 hypothetical protein WK25_23235 [Burkholderia latens]KVA04425.1 hypothetical protein WI41_20160 [Burkholderia latens]MBR8141345.1 hypothetical protein [Burkholderia vietnamiensis]MBY4697631.1 phage tail assembly chaperone [Burkholderia latens]
MRFIMSRPKWGKEHSFLRRASVRLWLFDEGGDEIGIVRSAFRNPSGDYADFVILLCDTAQA